jgi:hypothetical protein
MQINRYRIPKKNMLAPGWGFGLNTYRTCLCVSISTPVFDVYVGVHYYPISVGCRICWKPNKQYSVRGPHWLHEHEFLFGLGFWKHDSGTTTKGV